MQEVYNQENDIPKADQIDMLNRSIDYFKKADVFNENLFKDEVVNDPQIITAFEDFKNYYEEKNELALKDQFDVSNSAIKDEKKYFKHILKLDKMCIRDSTWDISNVPRYPNIKYRIAEAWVPRDRQLVTRTSRNT